MIYHVIGTMSGSSMDGLDIVHCTFEEIGGQWSVLVNQGECAPFNEIWKNELPELTHLSGLQLMLRHSAFGRWMGEVIHEFIEKNNFTHRVHLIASHGHTVFHEPQQHMTFQLGEASAIAAQTGIPVVSDLRNMDVALGGQGAPIVPIAEKYLWKDEKLLLNIGGICNISSNQSNQLIAFDICPANRVLNALAALMGKEYDDQGNIARSGQLNEVLLSTLNALPYYDRLAPKSLNNEFGIQTVGRFLSESGLNIPDQLRTYTEHIAFQIARAIRDNQLLTNEGGRMMITGGGAWNTYLIERIAVHLNDLKIEVFIPDENTIQYKEAIAMALIGVLRWREENNVLCSVSGASRDSIGGALWMP
ncbi:MAG: anhydro-N-acetylmuramic acid kinase [Chitinophagaceae bacterium]